MEPAAGRTPDHAIPRGAHGEIWRVAVAVRPDGRDRLGRGRHGGGARPADGPRPIHPVAYVADPGGRRLGRGRDRRKRPAQAHGMAHGERRAAAGNGARGLARGACGACPPSLGRSGSPRGRGGRGAVKNAKIDARIIDSRKAWIAAWASLAIMTIAYGAPLVAVMAMKPIAAGLWLSASGGLFELYTGHGVLMGLFGTSCMFSPLLTYVSRWFEKRRGAAVALISSGQSVAGALWPPLLQLGIDTIGWRHTMMMFGVFVAVAAISVTALFLRTPPDAPAASHPRTPAQRRASTLGLPPNLP